jgi:lysophospholipase L1-like esterase
MWSDYFHQLNDVRLDPLGLNFYPVGPQSEAAAKKPIIVFLGDSRAQGWTGPPEITQATFFNRGIGYQTTNQILSRFPLHVAPLKPQIVVIQAGTSDIKAIALFPERKAQILNDCKANIRRLIDASHQCGARVIVTTLFPFGKVPLERQPFWSDDVTAGLNEINDYIKSLKGDRIEVFDTTPILSKPDGLIDPKYSTDFLHLNATGYAALNQELVKFLHP